MENNENNTNNKDCLEKKVEYILINKVKFWIGFLTFVIPVIGFFFKIQLDIALIKQNHEAHMQTALEKIADLEEQNNELMQQLDTDHDAIIKLMTKVFGE